MIKLWRCAVLMAVAASGCALEEGVAHAQDVGVSPTVEQDFPNLGASFKRDNNISVLERQQPGYETIPVHLGSFNLTPTLTGGVAYDDNIYAHGASSGREGDEFGIVRADAAIASTWSRNSLSADIHSEYDGYLNHGDESHTTGGFDLQGRYDISGDTAVASQFSFDHLTESRLASGAPTFTKHPVQYDRTLFSLEGGQAFNRIRIEAAFDYSYVSFYNAETPENVFVQQAYRDRALYAGRIRAEYAVSPDTSIFVEARGNDRVYPSTLGNPSTYLRASHGYEFDTGVNFDLTQEVRGQVAVGYLDQLFKDPRLPTTDGLGARGQIEWFPTGLTTVTLRGQRELADSALAATPILTDSSVGVEVDHELLRNVVLVGRFDYGSDDYHGISRTDTRPSASLGANYLLNRLLTLKVLYTYLSQTSSGAQAGGAFNDNRILLTLAAHY